MSRKFRIKKEWIIYISIAIFTVLLNVLAWNSTGFCDAYIAYIFPIWVNSYGRITGLFTFSVGEWFLVVAVVLVVVAVILGLLWLFSGLIVRLQRKSSFSFIVNRMQSIGKAYYHFFVWLVLIVCVIMTLNWLS